MSLYIRKTVAVVAALNLHVASVNAHVGFLLPNTFHTSGDEILTVVASFSDRFPNPQVALRSEGFQIVKPDGTTAGIRWKAIA